jgi:hypothetical protein
MDLSGLGYRDPLPPILNTVIKSRVLYLVRKFFRNLTHINLFLRRYLRTLSVDRTVYHRWRKKWLWNTGEIILTGKTPNNRRKTYTSVSFYATDPTLSANWGVRSVLSVCLGFPLQCRCWRIRFRETILPQTSRYEIERSVNKGIKGIRKIHLLQCRRDLQ